MSKLIYILVFLVALIVGCFFLNDVSDDYEQDRIARSENKTTMDSLPEFIDIGKVPLDTILIQTVAIRNSGKHALVIREVSAECGCVSANFEKKPIPVDSVGVITLTVKPQGYGYFFKKVQVFTNTPVSPATFTVKGFVKLDRNKKRDL